MAAGLAGKRLGTRAEAASAGIGAVGGPPDPDAVLVMRILYGTDISGHRARSVVDVDIASFDYVVAMDFTVYSFLKSFGKIPEERLFSWDIEDPLGLGYDAFKQAALKIERRLDQFLAGIGLD
jgi:protein-tyrosine-phosphatase